VARCKALDPACLSSLFTSYCREISNLLSRVDRYYEEEWRSWGRRLEEARRVLEEMWRLHGKRLSAALKDLLGRSPSGKLICDLAYACRPHAGASLLVLNPFYSPKLAHKLPLDPRKARILPRDELIILLLHELMHYLLPELELLAHKASLKLGPAEAYSRLHRLMGLLEVEVLREAGFLPREPELAIEEASAYEYLLAGLGAREALKLREELLSKAKRGELLEALEALLRRQ